MVEHIQVSSNQKFFSFSEREIPSLLIETLVNKQVENVLEVGCGEGGLTEAILKLNKGYKITGIDYEDRLIAIARQRLKRKVSFKVGNALDLPFKNGEFSFVYSWMVLEHVNDPGKMISEIARVTKKDGKIYLGTIIKKSWAIYFYRKNGKFVIDPTHIHEFSSEDELRKLLENSGLFIKKEKISIKEYSIVELLLKLLMKIGIINPSFNIRSLSSRNLLFKYISKIKISIPGFYEIQVLCNKG